MQMAAFELEDGRIHLFLSRSRHFSGLFCAPKCDIIPSLCENKHFESDAYVKGPKFVRNFKLFVLDFTHRAENLYVHMTHRSQIFYVIPDCLCVKSAQECVNGSSDAITLRMITWLHPPADP